MTLAERVAETATALGRPRVLLAVDGPDAAGKTTFADAVAGVLTAPVVRASVDGFLNPVRVRRRRGELSPEGYYEDSFDYPVLAQDLLDPFVSGRRQVRTAGGGPAVGVPPEAVLVVDGVFLLRPRLRDWWTLTVYLHVPPEVTLERALVRDVARFGGEDEVRRRYDARYLPGQELYRSVAVPQARAHIVVDNSDPGVPVVLRWEVPGQPAQRTV